MYKSEVFILNMTHSKLTAMWDSSRYHQLHSVCAHALKIHTIWICARAQALWHMLHFYSVPVHTLKMHTIWTCAHAQANMTVVRSPLLLFPCAHAQNTHVHMPKAT